MFCHRCAARLRTGTKSSRLSRASTKNFAWCMMKRAGSTALERRRCRPTSYRQRPKKGQMRYSMKCGPPCCPLAELFFVFGTCAVEDTDCLCLPLTLAGISRAKWKAEVHSVLEQARRELDASQDENRILRNELLASEHHAKMYRESSEERSSQIQSLQVTTASKYEVYQRTFASHTVSPKLDQTCFSQSSLFTRLLIAPKHLIALRDSTRISNYKRDWSKPKRSSSEWHVTST